MQYNSWWVATKVLSVTSKCTVVLDCTFYHVLQVSHLFIFKLILKMTKKLILLIR